jgi:MSHA pilin protein MshB
MRVAAIRARANTTRASAAGFTLIELVIVVVILGLLAVTAIPKFLDLTDQAENANIEGMAGGFATAVSLVRAQWEAEGRPTINNRNTVSYDGTSFILTTENINAGIRPGYVTGLTTGETLTSFSSTNCLEIWQNILQQPPTASTLIADVNNGFADYLVNEAGSGINALCYYYLKNTLTRNNNGNFINPGTSTVVGNLFTYKPATSEIIVYVNQ